MRYLLLIHQGTTPTPRDPEAWEGSAKTSRRRSTPPTGSSTKLRGVTPGVAMEAPETATTVRVENGETLTTDGPFAETKEALGGYLVYEADDLDAAIALAAKIPAARLGGAIEVRPIGKGY